MRVVVVGAGLSGLFTASELIEAGVDDLVLVDKEPEPGGVVRTIARDGFALEPGAGTLMLPHPHLGPILSRSGVVTIPAHPDASRRYVYDGRRLVLVPSSPRALLAPVVPFHAKLRLLAEPLVGPGPASGDETLDSFCRRRFGDRAGELVGWLMASGVYAGDPRRLSVRFAFPALARLEQEHGSVMRGGWRRLRARSGGSTRPSPHLPAGGMAGLARSVAGSLGDRYLPGFEVGSIRRRGTGWLVEGPEVLPAEAVVIACRPDVAATMMTGELAGHLGRSTAAPVAVVGLGGHGPSPLPPGFGAIALPGSGLASVGVLFESSYAPDRAPSRSWLVKVIAGGATRPEVVGWDDRRLVDHVGQEVAGLVGSDLEASFVEVVRHLPGIPQYQTGHGRWLDELGGLLKLDPGLHLTGWGYRGVGVGQLASEAFSISRQVVAGGG